MDTDDTFTASSITDRFAEVVWRPPQSNQGLPERIIANTKTFLHKVEAFTAYDLPHYLFRVWSDSSAGFNCENGERKFQSQAAKAGLGATEFDSMPAEEIQCNLRKHLQWYSGPVKVPFYSHWISFTCSFLFALLHAWRKACRDEKNVMIAVIDTYKLKTPVHMFSAFPLIRAFGITDLDIKDSVYAEFLAYDNFEANMDVIPFSALQQPKPDRPSSLPHGLKDLCPFLKYSEAERRALRFKDKRLRLKSRMKKFRERRFPDLEILQVKPHERRVKAVVPWILPQGKRAGRSPMSQEKLGDFYRLVKPFTTEFRLPVLVSLLSLMTPEWEQDSMEEQVFYMFQGQSAS